MRTFTDDSPLFDDVKVFYWPIAGLYDALVCRIKPELTLLDEIRQMSVFHLVERREFLQELHGAVYVLQHGCLACLGERICLAHGLFRTLVIGAHGRPLVARCPLDVSLTPEAIGKVMVIAGTDLTSAMDCERRLAGMPTNCIADLTESAVG